MKAQVIFTDHAASKVKNLILDEGNPHLKLRVYITGGGCSGYQYGFTFDENKAEDDWEVENQEVGLLIDAASYTLLEGATIDYKSDVNGEQFIIRNPNAKTTCGCGSSFSA
ncbi:MAG: iron-sulfur cluster insertion protein ErpA [Gammaproteobacteria bacterium]|nr:iron-sulfur cluster insertion protein ErpA [Gammaproteobacteria bacterium]